MNTAKIEPGGAVEIVNSSGYELDEVARALPGSRDMVPLRDALMEWHRKTHPNPRGRMGSMVDRDRYLTPDSYFSKVITARAALKDDVVGNAADGTEAMALSGCGIVNDDLDEQDIWNQIAGDINLDEYNRKFWREAYTASACTTAIWWGRKTYKVRGKGDGGAAKRKEHDLVVPLGLSILDSAKIAPVGSLDFGQEQLCYAADPIEAVRIEAILAERDGTLFQRAGGRGQLRRIAQRSSASDIRELRPVVRRYGPEHLGAVLQDDLFMGADLISRLMLGRYTPDPFEGQDLRNDGVDPNFLYLLDPRAVFRHTLTKGDYRRFPDVRLESVFEILDQKAQLRAMDRVLLIGGTNYLIIVKRGTDAKPAEQAEVDQTRAGFSTISQVPVIVSDHRIDVEILTPKTDYVLDREKYDTIDSRLFARAWGSFVPTGQDNDDPVKLGRVIGQGLESRRRMQRRTTELRLFERIRVLNPALQARAKLVFKPKHIALAFDKALASFVIDMRAAGELSRDSTLSTFDFDEGDEALLIERERKLYDEKFKTDWTPNGQGSAGDDGEPNPTQNKAASRRGGRRGGGNRKGGGDAPGTNQGGQQSQDPIGRGGKGKRGDREAAADDVDEEGAEE